MPKYDLIVVGAGIVGLTSALYIKKNNPDLSILVVDKAQTYGQGNTARSAAGFRDLFTSPINFNLSHSTIGFYRHIQEETGFNLGMQFVGYLFLLPRKNRLDEQLQNIGNKTKLRYFDGDQISKVDGINLEPSKEMSELLGLEKIDHAVLGENCGIIEPDLVCSYYYNELRSLGVEFSFSTEVTALRLEPENPLNFPGEPFLWQKKRIGSIATSRGDMVSDQYLLATDVWTTALTDPLGVDSHVRPKKREIFQVSGDIAQKILHTSGFNNQSILPFTIMPHYGVYLRPAPKENSLWVGVADDIGRDFSFEEQPEAREEYYQNNLRQVLEAYWNRYDSTRLTSMWAGYYCYNTIDKAPYIYRSMNVTIADGTSGSGILKGDSIGRYVAAVYAGKKEAKLYGDVSVDSSLLGIEGRNVPVEKIIL